MSESTVVSMRTQGLPPIEIDDEAASSRARQKADPEVGGIAVDRLRSIIERVERLNSEKDALSSDIKDIFAEAKSAGFDVKVVRTLVSIRKKDPDEVVEEQETLLDLYKRALGM